MLNNPVRYRDPSGHWVETLFDVAMIGWDIAEVRRDPSLLNIGALVVDVAAVVVPFVPSAAGLAVRGGKIATGLVTHGDDAVAAVRAAGHLVDGAQAILRADNALQAANRLRTVDATSDAGQQLVRQIAGLSTNGTVRATGNTVVLGRFKAMDGFKGYIDKANELDAVYFNTPSMDVWNALDDPWLVNQQFLDDAIARGDKFWIEADIFKTLNELRPDGTRPFLRLELEHLFEKGYRIDGGFLVKP